MKLTHVDVHSHLNDKRFADDLPDVLSRMRTAGVASIVVGTDKGMSERAVALAEAHEDIWATVGEHPTDHAKEEFDDAWYARLATHPRVVAIGECGLDYYWPDKGGWPSGENEEKHRQRELFERHIALAKITGKPLMLHGRPSGKSMDAYEDMLEILKGGNVVGNVHFFVGNIDVAKRFLDIGFTMSFTGVLTFTHDYDEIVRYLPLESIHAETDAPYVAPVPYRGERNEPAHVLETMRAIARIRSENLDIMSSALVINAEKKFGVRVGSTEERERPLRGKFGVPPAR